MIDTSAARTQVANRLLTVCNNVKMTRPEGNAVLPLICYGLTSSLPLNVAYTRMKWRIACYASTMQELLTMVNGVIGIMSDELGFTLTSETPDDETRKGTDFYMKRLDFSATVSNENGGVIKWST